MAKKEEEDDDEALDLKAIVKIAKMRPMNFAMAPGKSTPVALLAHKRLDPSRLAEKVKKQGVETAKLVYGTMSVQGATLRLNTSGKVQPQLLKALKQMLQSQKIQLKPVAPGAEDGEDEDEGPDPEALKGIAQSVGKAVELVGKQIAELAKSIKAAAGGEEGGAPKEIEDAAKKTDSILKSVSEQVAEAAKKAAAETDGKRRGKLAEAIEKSLATLSQQIADQKVQGLAKNELSPVPGVAALTKAVKDAMAGLK